MPSSTKVKPQPTAEDLHDVMESVQTLEDEIERIHDAVRRFDLLNVPQIGVAGAATLNEEIDKARAAIEWLGIIFGDAEDALLGLTTGSNDTPI